MKPITVGFVASIVLLVTSACATDGSSGTSIGGIDVGAPLEDSLPLTVQVREKLRNDGQTALSIIRVSAPTEDTVRLAGTVNTEATRQTAETLAYQVEGVRFVVNTLEVSN